MKNKLLTKDIFDIKTVLLKERTSIQMNTEKNRKSIYIKESNKLRIERLNELIKKLEELE